MFNFLLEKVYRKFENLIDAQITGRIVTFHHKLVEQKQINPPLKEEKLGEITIPDCNQDHVVL